MPSLRDLAGLLMGTIVLPYLGPEAAREELLRPLPVREAGCPRGPQLQ
jgi:hypothetical protein